MSKYAENNLRNGEEIVLKAKINPLAAIKSIIAMIIWIALGIVCFVFSAKFKPDASAPSGSELASNGTEVLSRLLLYVGIACLVIGALVIIARIIYLLSLCLVVTNKRVFGKVGIIKKKSLDYPIDKVESIQLKSTFWGAIFHFDSLIIMGSGGSTEIVFTGISNANIFKNTVTDAIEQHQAEARKSQAEEIAMAMKGGRF